MALNYFQRVVFSILEVISGLLNLSTSLIGKNPTWDLDGWYLKRILDSIYYKNVKSTVNKRRNAENDYNENVQRITRSV
jgi:hypothetical protein